MTKVFTATVVLQLAAEHKVDLDEPVQHYLPDLLPSSYPDVTVRQLLDHTSGLPEDTLEGSGPTWFVAHRFDSWSPRQVVASAVARPMSFAPGTRQEYNGTNYFVAGMLIEKVSGHSYGQEVDSRIVRPLGLRGTSLPDRRDAALPGPHAHGYVRLDGQLVDITEQAARGWAESGMISTSADLTRLFTALFQGRLVPAPQLDEMFTVPDVDYPGTDNCHVPGDPHAGRACFSAGLVRTTWSSGVTTWGKSGSVPGYTGAVFATRDLSRVMVYSLNPTGDRDGSETPYIIRLAAASFDPGLADR